MKRRTPLQQSGGTSNALYSAVRHADCGRADLLIKVMIVGQGVTTLSIHWESGTAVKSAGIIGDTDRAGHGAVDCMRDSFVQN
jgi:hypothetical protein